MATTLGASSHLLTQQIHHHLDTDLPETANFLAGRLHALEPRSPDSAHLLALTYFRLRRLKAAADTAQKFGSNGRHLGCAYVFAQACLQLGRATEGVGALEKSKSSWTGKAQRLQQRFMPSTAACWTLLGKLWQTHGDLRKAGDCFVEAHKANPFTWEAFDGLCSVGADLNVQHIFRPSTDMLPEGTLITDASRASDEIYTDAEEQTTAQPLAAQLNFNQQIFTPSADPFGTSTKPGVLDYAKGKPALKAPLSEWDTPVGNGGNGVEDDAAMSEILIDSETNAIHPPPAPSRRTRPGQQPFDAADRPRQPTLRNQTLSVSEDVHDGLPNAPQHSRKASSTTVGGHKRTISGHHTSATESSNAHQPIRRSNRLGQSTTSTASTRTTSSRPTTADSTAQVGTVRPAKPATGTKGRMASTVGRVVSGNRKILPADRNRDGEKEKRALSRASEREKSATTVSTAQAESKTSIVTHPAGPKPVANVSQPAPTFQLDMASLTNLLDHLRLLASATYSLSRSETGATLRTLRSLPVSQRETPYPLALLARTHYEAGDYKASEETFIRLLKLQPSRTQDTELYSTVLWHLKKDAPLAFLCMSLRDIDSTAPETWCAVGNAFSLAREHDQAIAAFKRSVQVDPKFAYAWTLMGHEFIANEDFDSAMSSFRHAVAIDRRGFGGWYGLGKCSERIGKLEDAERHFRIASSLNPTNSTLLVCIGLVLERQRNRRAALTQYSKALELAPSSALARFKKARVLMHLRMWEEALAELEMLREVAAEEANVWFLLGKCYRALGDRGEGLRCFTYALNLDGKVCLLHYACDGRSHGLM